MRDHRRVFQRLRRLADAPKRGPFAAPVRARRVPLDGPFDRIRSFETCSSLAYRKAAYGAVDYRGTHQHLVTFAWKLQRAAVEQGVPLVVDSLRRSAEQQNHMFNVGLSAHLAGESPHSHGYAVDFRHYTLGFDLRPREWAAINDLAQRVAFLAEIPVTWGGTLDWFQPMHWELTGWEDRLPGEDVSFLFA